MKNLKLTQEQLILLDRMFRKVEGDIWMDITFPKREVSEKKAKLDAEFLTKLDEIKDILESAI